MPVWVNLREVPFPDLPQPIIDAVLVGARLDAERRVVDLLSQGFFLRSAVLTPDGQTLLNPQPATIMGSWELSQETGYFSYAQTTPSDYRAMLDAALEEHRRTSKLDLSRF